MFTCVSLFYLAEKCAIDSLFTSGHIPIVLSAGEFGLRKRLYLHWTDCCQSISLGHYKYKLLSSNANLIRWKAASGRAFGFTRLDGFAYAGASVPTGTLEGVCIWLGLCCYLSLAGDQSRIENHQLYGKRSCTYCEWPAGPAPALSRLTFERVRPIVFAFRQRRIIVNALWVLKIAPSAVRI